MINKIIILVTVVALDTCPGKRHRKWINQEKPNLQHNTPEYSQTQEKLITPKWQVFIIFILDYYIYFRFKSKEKSL